MGTTVEHLADDELGSIKKASTGGGNRHNNMLRRIIGTIELADFQTWLSMHVCVDFCHVLGFVCVVPEPFLHDRLWCSKYRSKHITYCRKVQERKLGNTVVKVWRNNGVTHPVLVNIGLPGHQQLQTNALSTSVFLITF